MRFGSRRCSFFDLLIRPFVSRGRRFPSGPAGSFGGSGSSYVSGGRRPCGSDFMADLPTRFGTPRARRGRQRIGFSNIRGLQFYWVRGRGHPKRVPFWFWLERPMLPTSLDAVLEDGGPVLRHWNFELSGPRRRFGEVVRVGEHFPVTADGFVYFDNDGRILVIAQRDFKFHFPGVVVDAFVVGLFALGDDVKSVA